LLDEPLSNLDLKRETDLLHLINGVVRSRGVTVLLIAHNINPLLPHLDKVMYIANGGVASGKPSEVLTSESLSTLYGIQVEVLRDPHGNVAIIGVEEHHGDMA
jgi:zinc/manganese transport system ATP-binding protein